MNNRVEIIKRLRKRYGRKYSLKAIKNTLDSRGTEEKTIQALDQGLKINKVLSRLNQLAKEL